MGNNQMGGHKSSMINLGSPNISLKSGGSAIKSERKQRSATYAGIESCKNNERLLTSKEKQLIIESYEQLKASYPQFQKDAWYTAAESHPEIKTVFGFKRVSKSSASADSESGSGSTGIGPAVCPAKTTASFERATHAAESFLNAIILMDRLDDAQIKHKCWALGVAHCLYIHRGFQAAYWDIFIYAMIEPLKQWIIKEYCPHDDSLLGTALKRQQKLIATWEKFIQLVVDLMKLGYEHQRIVES